MLRRVDTQARHHRLGDDFAFSRTLLVAQHDFEFHEVAETLHAVEIRRPRSQAKTVSSCSIKVSARRPMRWRAPARRRRRRCGP